MSAFNGDDENATSIRVSTSVDEVWLWVSFSASEFGAGRPFGFGFWANPMVLVDIGEKSFQRVWTSKQQAELNLRTLHLVVRSQGCALPAQLGNTICEYLLQRYQTKKWWAEAIDCATIQADMAFNNRDAPFQVGFALAKAIVAVGESLECAGKFKQAALLYDEVVKLYLTDTTTPGYSEAVATVSANCALAYKRAGDYSAAEKAYVDALRRATPTVSHIPNKSMAHYTQSHRKLALRLAFKRLLASTTRENSGRCQ